MPDGPTDSAFEDLGYSRKITTGEGEKLANNTRERPERAAGKLSEIKVKRPVGRPTTIARDGVPPPPHKRRKPPLVTEAKITQTPPPPIDADPDFNLEHTALDELSAAITAAGGDRPLGEMFNIRLPGHEPLPDHLVGYEAKPKPPPVHNNGPWPEPSLRIEVPVLSMGTTVGYQVEQEVPEPLSAPMPQPVASGKAREPAWTAEERKRPVVAHAPQPEFVAPAVGRKRGKGKPMTDAVAVHKVTKILLALEGGDRERALSFLRAKFFAK